MVAKSVFKKNDESNLYTAKLFVHASEASKFWGTLKGFTVKYNISLQNPIIEEDSEELDVLEKHSYKLWAVLQRGCVLENKNLERMISEIESKFKK